jgi:hypothetical protein
MKITAKHFMERQDNIQIKLVALLEKIADAWDLDEVQMYAEDLFGKDIHDPVYRNEMIDKAVNETTISAELRKALEKLTEPYS